MPNSKISPEEFITAWQSSQTLAEVTRKLGMSNTQAKRTALNTRAANYRKKGVALKKFKKRERQGHDWKYLAYLADEALK